MMKPGLESVVVLGRRTIRVCKRFVTVLCQDLKMMTIMTDLHFAESISYVD
jgi:hypothetical protein